MRGRIQLKEFVSGAEVIARAAVEAGCNFFAGYPITPATAILLQMMQLMPKNGGVAIQGEDEIASIGFCLGASAAGRKVMTATSGPGMSLYSENLGLAQMAELPLVIVNVQRMGPATGGATTNAEGDIMFARWGTSGGYPLIVLCPSTLEESYTLTHKAFSLAEQFRTPVILITCKELVMSKESIELNAYQKSPRVERPMASSPENYKPYTYTKSGDVPPFTPLGGPIISRVNTSIHDQNGIITKDPAVMEAALNHLSDKILNGMESIVDLSLDLQPESKHLIISYGLAARSAREAVLQARQAGKKVSHVVVRSLWPLPEKALQDVIARHETIIVPEHNLGQYASELQRFSGDKTLVKINRIDGEAIEPRQIVEKL